jgi:hypothetical protein
MLDLIEEQKQHSLAKASKSRKVCVQQSVVFEELSGLEGVVGAVDGTVTDTWMVVVDDEVGRDSLPSVEVFALLLAIHKLPLTRGSATWQLAASPSSLWKLIKPL